MGRRLRLDCSAGVCGNMLLAALVDLGAPIDHLRVELAGLGLRDCALSVWPERRGSVTGTRVEVAFARSGGATHTHTTLAEIVSVVEGSTLSSRVKGRVIAVFDCLARAEATVHGRTPETVRFHEVGAPDAVMEVAGVAVCLEWLSPESIECGPLELGSGTVRCAHGVVPVPAPATAEILRVRGIPTTRGALPFEASTPTGVAILAALVDRFTSDGREAVGHPGGDAPRVGRGFGSLKGESPGALEARLVPAAAREGT